MESELECEFLESVLELECEFFVLELKLELFRVVSDIRVSECAVEGFFCWMGPFNL